MYIFEYFNDSQNGEWEEINHDDCLLPDEKLDMGGWAIVEKPNGSVDNANVIAKKMMKNTD